MMRHKNCGRLGIHPIPWKWTDVSQYGAGVSGLTVVSYFAERGYRTAIFAKHMGSQTTSAKKKQTKTIQLVAVWFPYHVERGKVIHWPRTYQVLVDLAKGTGPAASPKRGTPVFERRNSYPDWAIPRGASHVGHRSVPVCKSGFYCMCPNGDYNISITWPNVFARWR